MDQVLQDIWLSKDSSDPFYKKVAYFSMEVAVDQSLKTYSAGLGYLAGSYLRSAYALKQNIVGISLLWSYGYYTQTRASNNEMRIEYINYDYPFLKPLDFLFNVVVSGHKVKVRAFLLEPKTFGTAPIFFLSTDIDENDPISRTITRRLYDSNAATRIAQSIILGVGGVKLLEILDLKPDVYHLNESHALPLAFYLYSKNHRVEEVVNNLVFTTHTMQQEGSNEYELKLLDAMNFFCGLPIEEVIHIAHIEGNTMNYTLTALRLSRKANGVSKKHGEVVNNYWAAYKNICPIITITNGQNREYWSDKILNTCISNRGEKGILNRKKELKEELFRVVADQTGKHFDPHVLTIVWARQFVNYKRPALLLRNLDRFIKLIENTITPIQVIWAGKPYPEDYEALSNFQYIQNTTSKFERCAILVGYELELSALLKKGTDVWLNNPRTSKEASGTSGISAAMNGAINLTVMDGWVPEFAKKEINGFYLPTVDQHLPLDKQDEIDNENLMNILEKNVIPTFYQKPEKWLDIIKNSMKDIYPDFDSDRMVREYYEKLY